jgi:RNA polymerase sigma factor (sigma-70 family)
MIDHAAERIRDPAAREPDEQIHQERLVKAVLAQLPPLYAAILVMKKRDGLSYEEIARALQISVHTVKKYLFRAVAQARAANWSTP